MPAIIAAIAAGGLDFGSSYFGNKSEKKHRKRMQKRMNRAISTTEAIQGRGLQQQQALSKQATAERVGGYDAAKREAERLGRSSKQGALDRGNQLGATLSQQLTNSGLGSTTRGANLQRGISADTSRTIGGINEGMAGMLGNLDLGRSQAQAAGTEQQGQLLGQQADLMSSLRQMGLLGGSTLGNFQLDMSRLPSTAEMLTHAGQTGLGVYEGMGGGSQNSQLMAMLKKLFSGYGGSSDSGTPQGLGTGDSWS